MKIRALLTGIVYGIALAAAWSCVAPSRMAAFPSESIHAAADGGTSHHSAFNGAGLQHGVGP